LADYASESGHWYTRSGEPCYTVVGKTGERPTTLRDARKMDLVPGVTSIIRMAAAPGLDRYKQRMLFTTVRDMMATGDITGPINEDEWFAEALKRSQEQAKNAADRGTEIHAALELARKYRPYDYRLIPWVQDVDVAISEKCGIQTWNPEKSYAHGDGYGCKIDLHSQEWLIDYKGKDDTVKVVLFDEHYMQLAANRMAARIPNARCAIVFFGRQTPWAKFIEAEENELRRGFAMFSCLLRFWQYKNRIGS
jgi:hypothetical protein